ncbi:hypothetical protein L9F63_023664, partial [Diploptera punctata]
FFHKTFSSSVFISIILTVTACNNQSSNVRSEFFHDMCNAMVAANIPCDIGNNYIWIAIDETTDGKENLTISSKNVAFFQLVSSCYQFYESLEIVHPRSIIQFVKNYYFISFVNVPD